VALAEGFCVLGGWCISHALAPVYQTAMQRPELLDAMLGKMRLFYL
jgi:hypothetical protein